MSTLIRNFLHDFRSWAGLHPAVFYSTYPIMRKNRNLIVRRDSELVIEGYPRSANTYSVVAFQFAQQRSVQLGHHLHVPAQIFRAVQWGIPAIVLLREARGAVSSLLVRHPELDPARCIRDYIDFYTTLEPYRHGFIIGGFEEVVYDFGAVIDRVNKRFGTSFSLFDSTQANVEKVFSLIDDIHKSARRDSQQIARPSREKEKRKHEISDFLMKKKFQGLFDVADDIRMRFSEVTT